MKTKKETRKEKTRIPENGFFWKIERFKSLRTPEKRSVSGFCWYDTWKINQNPRFLAEPEVAWFGYSILKPFCLPKS